MTTNTEDFSGWLNNDTEGTIGNLLRLAALTAAVGAIVGYLIGRAQ